MKSNNNNNKERESFLPLNTGKSPTSSSRGNSRAASPTMSDDDLPTNVNTKEQLDKLPEECLSGDEKRPLLHIEESGEEFHYALEPMTYSVVFILLVELLERFVFYGVTCTQTSYLTGVYNDDWNANMEAISAATYVSISIAVAYTTPFFGAFLGESLVGEYWAIFIGSLCFYLPGLCLIALTTVPHLLGETFNRTALSFGLLFLWPCGTGIVKSLVNVLGAKQFHPLLQSSMIESYYVKFYTCINVGALLGGIIVPLLAQWNVTIAYCLPVVMLSIGVSIFALGSSRYVKQKPKDAICGKNKKEPSSTPSSPAQSIDLSVIFRISFLIIPFNIAYSQMSTTFIVQGTVMEKAFGFIDASCMNNADAIAVLFFGYIIGDILYPALADRDIKIPTTYKFAIGSLLGSMSIGWALFLDYRIHSVYEHTGHKISILWQAISYVCIGAGEIFAVSAAYEVAFTAAPPEMKVKASAVNLFAIGGIPNVVCIGLYNACRTWFENKHGNANISHIKDYSTAHVVYYFWLLFAIALLGVIVNVLPPIRKFVEGVEETSAEMIKTPKTPMRPPRREREEENAADEESALLKAKKHQAYLKYGSGPSLVRHGSMRASMSMRKSTKQAKALKKMLLKELYGSDASMRQLPTAKGSKSKYVTGTTLISPPQMKRDEADIPRSNSTTM